MLGHGAKFGRKMEQAIAALLSNTSVEAAARAVGVSANTLLRWMKEPEFEDAYREARRTAFVQSIGRLPEASGAAVTTVLKIMLDPKTPPAIRLRAAEVALERGAQSIEIEDFEARLAAMERAVGSVTRSRKNSPVLTVSPTRALVGSDTTPAEISAPRPENPDAEDDDGE
jgi:hypothetical protein